MPIVVVGLNHRSAPMDILERLSLSSDRIPDALDSLITYDHVDHCVLVSTCNRVEIYAEVTAIEGGIEDLESFLASIADLTPEDIIPSLYAHEGEDAARHLFRVAAGLDSLLVGETEILGQVKRAFRTAVERGTVGRLDVVFRHALSAGKRSRTAAGPASRRASTSSATVELLTSTCGGGAGGRIVIVGAGSLGAAIARELHGAGMRDLVIVNRSEERGRELARVLGATFVSLDRLEHALEGAAALVCSVSADTAIVDRVLLERVVSRQDAPPQLLVVDLGVPRNVDPLARDLSGVRLCDLRDLLQSDPGLSSQSEKVTEVEELISVEVDRYREWEQASHLSPTLSALVAKGEAIREQELERFLARTNHLSSQQTEEIDQLSRRIVAKLLHSPLVTAKKVAASDEGSDCAGVMRELFGLEEVAPAF